MPRYSERDGGRGRRVAEKQTGGKIKPRKPQGDLITGLSIDLLSRDVEITSLNQ